MPRDAVRDTEKNNLTVGPIVPKLVRFSIPIIAGNLMQQLYNVVDTIVVGNFVSSNAVAAVGASFPLMMVFNSLFFGVSAGATVVISQYFGARNQRKLRDAGDTTYTMALILGAFITVMGLLFAKGLLSVLNTPADIIGDSSTYLSIIFAGTMGSILYNLCSGVLRGLGDSKWPFYLLAVSSVLNIILDLVFVIYFDMGVAGVAWATIIAQWVSGMLAVIRLNSSGYGVTFQLKYLKLVPDCLSQILRLGMPAGFQMVANSLGMLIIQTFSNGFGSDFVAANTIIMKVDGFAVMPMMGLGVALTTFTGQNIGAHELDRVKKGTKATLSMVFAIGIGMGALLYFCGIYLMQVFTQNAAVLEIGERGIHVLAFMYCLMGGGEALAGVLRGSGDSMPPMLISVGCQFLRLPVAYFIAVMPHNYMGLFYSMMITTIVRFALMALYHRSGKWQTKGITGRGAKPGPQAPDAPEAPAPAGC